MSSIKTIFTNIANAIREKKGTTTKYLPENMSAEISTIETGTDTSDATAIPRDILLDKTAYANGEKIIGTIQTYNNEHENGYVQINSLKKLLDTTKSTYSLFSGYEGTSVNDLISYSDTENVTDAGDMFYHCLNLQSIPLLNTSKVTRMNSMFNYCTKLQTISQLNTSNVTNFSGMFTLCFNLQSIPQLDTSNGTDMSYMFERCYKLSTIDITHMKITSTSGSSVMCNYCYSLTKFIIRNMDTIPALSSDAFSSCYHFTGTVNATYNPDGLKDGRIYVPDGMVYQLKQATNWSVYADIIVPLSTLVE